MKEAEYAIIIGNKVGIVNIPVPLMDPMCQHNLQSCSAPSHIPNGEFRREHGMFLPFLREFHAENGE